jgi:hypothetical protein
LIAASDGRYPAVIKTSPDFVSFRNRISCQILNLTEFFMRGFSIALLALTLSASGVLAASGHDQFLPAGKPAGVKAAQMLDSNKLLIIGGIGVLAGGIAAISAQGQVQTAPSTTTGTP